MLTFYLYFNSVLYTLFAIWCTAMPQKTSNALGYQLLNSSGRSEYLVVYGALQLGMALFYAITAYKTDLQFSGLLFSLCLYIPLVSFRAVSFFLFANTGSTTVFTAVLEAILAVTAIYLYFKH